MTSTEMHEAKVGGGAAPLPGEKQKTKVRAIVFPLDKMQKGRNDGHADDRRIGKALGKPGEAPGATEQLPEDPFVSLGEQAQILMPPFDLLTLAMLAEQNTEMTPCIEAMQVNCDGLGHRLVPRVNINTKTAQGLVDSVEQEAIDLENFFAYASIDDSFTELRKKRRYDLETTGNAYWEVIRGRYDAHPIQGFEHCPSYLVRLGRQDQEAVEVDVPIVQLQKDGSVKIVMRKAWRRFRRYAMVRSTLVGSSVASTGEVRWFKQFGDPRIVDKRNGNVAKTDEEGKVISDGGNAANEMMHWRLYTPRSPYGLPRFIGNLLNIFGSRAAEETNYVTFLNNNVPSMMIMVSNGQLTDATVKRIEEFAESRISGSQNYSQILIIEAEDSGDGEITEDGGNVKISAQPLIGNQHTDALFTNYTKEAKSSVRGVWRISPLFLGRAEDYTRSNAEEGKKITDEQVFAPERDDFDMFVNRVLFPMMGFVYHRYRSNSPNVTSNAELIKITGDAEKTGGMTPAIARQVLEQILNVDLPDFPQDFPKDIPFSLLMAQAVKNFADPTQPGQQVTAIKEGEPPPPDQRVTDPVKFVNELVDARRRLEQGWRGLMGHSNEDAGDGTAS